MTVSCCVSNNSRCRIHGREAVNAVIDGKAVLVCPQCAIEGMDPQAGLGPPKTRQVKRFTTGGEREDDVQRQIVRALREAGYTVLQTSRRRKRCVHCGRYSTGGDGADRGVPDLIVRNPVWPPAMWLGIEVKGGKTAVSPEQRELLGDGAIVIARSPAEALRHCQRADSEVPEYDPFVPNYPVTPEGCHETD